MPSKQRIAGGQPRRSGPHRTGAGLEAGKKIPAARVVLFELEEDVHAVLVHRPTCCGTVGRRAWLRRVAQAAAAETYPDRPVRIVLPFGAGGVGDISSRIVAEKLGDKLGKRFIIENMPSADSIVAARAVLNAPADGYSILLLTGGIAGAVPQYKEFPFDLSKLTPVSSMGYFDCLMAVNAKSDFKTLEDFLKAAKAKPGTLNVAAVSTGGVQSLTANYFKQASGANFVIVPFRTTPDAIVALLRNDVQVIIDFYAALKPGLQSGQTRAIAWTGPTPSPAMPDVKTASEQGMKDFSAASWNSFYVKVGTRRTSSTR